MDLKLFLLLVVIFVVVVAVVVVAIVLIIALNRKKTQLPIHHYLRDDGNEGFPEEP